MYPVVADDDVPSGKLTHCGLFQYSGKLLVYTFKQEMGLELTHSDYFIMTNFR